MAGIKLLAGVDEAGRGPLAGPVYAAAVILDPQQPIPGLRDSKKLLAKQRERLVLEIQEKALAYAVAFADVAEIESLNILQASLLAMQRAVTALSLNPHEVLVDGNRCPEFACPARAIIGGDNIEPAISAASILAKVSRDQEMINLDQQYPGYGFAQHKGYGTAQHCEALRQRGATPIHRQMFIRNIISSVQETC